MHQSQTRRPWPKAAIAITVAWTALHLYLSWNRSIWQDEVMRLQQMQMGFAEAMHSLFLEPSPFAPGEIVLGFLCKALFGAWTPFELWGRLPSVLWGTLTLLCAASLGSTLLTALLALSVAVTTMGTQFRPYAALIFSGALAFHLVWDRRSLSRGQSVFVWFSLIFSHLYGICFIGAASLLRWEWGRAVFSVLYIAALYWAFKAAHHGQVLQWGPTAWTFDTREFTQHTLRMLGNPYTISFLLLPLAIWGVVTAFRQNRWGTVWGVTLLVCGVGGPLLADILGSYGYIPRQAVGAVFPYLFFVAWGAMNLPQKIRVPAAALLLALMFRSWWLYTSDGRPPIGEQPLHKHKHLVEMAQREKFKNVALLDPGGTGFLYFEQAYGPQFKREYLNIGQRVFIQVCWESGFCLYQFNEPEFAWKDINELGQDPAVMAFLNGAAPRFDAVFATVYKFTLPLTAPLYRTW